MGSRREGGRPAEPGGGEGGAAGSLRKGPQEGSKAGLESPPPSSAGGFWTAQCECH